MPCRDRGSLLAAPPGRPGLRLPESGSGQQHLPERDAGSSCRRRRKTTEQPRVSPSPRPSPCHRGRPALASPAFQAATARCSGQKEGGAAGRGGRKEGPEGPMILAFLSGQAASSTDRRERATSRRGPARQRRCRFCLREFAPAALYLAADGTHESVFHSVKSRGRYRWFGSFAGVRAAKGHCERETGASSFVRRHPPSLQLYLVARRVSALSCGCCYYVKEQRDFMPHCPTGTSLSCSCLQSC